MQQLESLLKKKLQLHSKDAIQLNYLVLLCCGYTFYILFMLCVIIKITKSLNIRQNPRTYAYLFFSFTSAILNQARAILRARSLLCQQNVFQTQSTRNFLLKTFQIFTMHETRSLRLIRRFLYTPTIVKQVRKIHLSRMSSKPVRALIMGPPGSGKGTVSERIVNTFSVTHLSSGDVLRSQIKEGTEVGLKAKKIVEKGGLVPDEIMIELILNKMKELGEGSWLLDGKTF